MVTIVGQVLEPSGLATTAPFKVWLVNYGTDPVNHRLYVSPSPQIVTPDPITGQFEFEVWANVTADVPCYYRVQFDFGLQLKLAVPASDTPLEFTDLIIDETIELLPGILSRVARLESTGGVVIPTQNFSVGGWLTSPPVAYDGTAPVVIPVDSINSQGLTGVIPKPLLSGSYNITLDNALSFGQGLTATSGSYSGGSANSVSVDATIARRSDVAMSDPREWLASTVSQLEAETGTGVGRRAWTPERVFQAITAWVSQYLPSATLGEAELGTGTNNLSWSPSKITALVSAYTSSNGVTSVAGKVGDVSLVPTDIVGLGDVTNASNLLTGSVNSTLVPLAQSATRLATARTVNGVPFDGTANIVVPTPSSLTFGTGLTGGVFNGSTATTLAIDTGVVVQQSDSRLTDAREWSASTVTQAEAEAGTATTRRAWTAQRVTQTIAAWWASSANKVKLDSIATGAQVNTVTSVAGKTGVVTLVKGDVGLGNVVNSDQTNASNLATGVVADARLSSNVVLKNQSPVFTGGRVTLGRQNSVSEGGELQINYPENNGSTTTSSWYIDCQGTASSPNLRFYTTDSVGVSSTVLQLAPSVVNATSTTSAASIKTAGGIACAQDIYANKVIYTQSDVISFTPYLEGTGWGYGIQQGEYTRTGRVVHFYCRLDVNQVGVGGLRVLGLPFNCNSNSFSVNMRTTGFQNIPTGAVYTPYVEVNKTSIVLNFTQNGSVATNFTPFYYTSACTMYLAGHYITSS